MMLFAIPAVARSEERFITIQKVVGNRIEFSESAGGRGRGGGMGQGRGMRGGRGRGRGGGNTSQTQAAVIPTAAKITAAMRERRTFEFRVGIELAGGMRHPVFTQMQKPLSARIVTQGNRITELNVITADTDVNQRNTSSSGQTVIAVKPRRPPSRSSSK
ncbi:hypothetical protein [Roseimaritima ulvae]|nr:hypothetical protein [Roseimaritima ulvae]